jgi:4a-hydroxytetrahydrobiopterin dehydratase
MPLLSSDEVRQQLETLTGWEVAGAQIRKRYAFGGFKEAMTFVNHVAARAEEMDHHPEILVDYDKVTLTSTSHDLGGLTRRDFALAQRIDS